MGPSLPDSNNTEIGILITTTADPAGLDDMQEQLDTTSESLQSIGDVADEAAGQVSAATSEMQDAFVSLGATTDEYDANLQAIIAEVGEFEGGLTIAADGISASNDVIIQSNDALIASYGELSAAAEETAVAQDTSGGIGDLGTGLAEGAGMGGIASKLSSPYVLAGAAVAGAFALMIKSASSFQTLMLKLYNTAGETANYNDLATAIKGVSDATGLADSQLLQAQYFISSAGYSALDGVDILKAAAEAAQEEGANVTDVADALTTVMVDMQAPAKQATAYMNELLTAVAHGKTTLQDLSNSLSTILPIAKTAGLSFAQVGGAIDVMTDAGVSADEATQNIRSLVQELSGANLTANEVSYFQDIGLSVTSLEQNLGKEGLTGTLQEVAVALANYTHTNTVILPAMQNATTAQQNLNAMIKAAPGPVQTLATELVNGQIGYANYRTAIQSLTNEGFKNLGTEIENEYNKTQSFNQLLTSNTPAVQTYVAALKQVFGNVGAEQAADIIMGNLPAANRDVQAISKSASDAGNNVQGWNDQTKTLKTTWDQFTKTLENVGETIGSALLPYLTEFFKDMDTILGPMAKFLSEGNSMHDVTLGIGDAFSAMIAPLKLVYDSIETMVKGVNDLREAFDSITSKGNFSIGKAAGGLLNDFKNLIPGFASGVTNFGGGLALVGEGGPELVYLPQGSSVIPGTNSAGAGVVNTSNSSTTNSEKNIQIGQVNLSTAAAVSAFIAQLDLDSLSVSKGLTATRGVA